MKLQSVMGSILLMLASGVAYAGAVPPTAVPEPGILELLSVGAVIGLVVAIRNRRK